MEPIDTSNRALSRLLGGTAAYIPVNSKTNMSSLRPSPILDSAPTFSSKIASDQKPIRLQDQSKILEELDKLYNATKHPLLDTNHMSGRGHALAPHMDDQEPTIHEAREILDKHIKAREPYVELASKRLHTVIGMNNHKVFDLPFHISPKPSPTFDPSPFSNLKRKRSAIVLAGSKFIFDGGIQVDAATGNGLREWLIGMGKANGSQRKQECQSISFHDFRPDKDGKFSNVLIAHFSAAECIGRRVDVYEVELPTIILDPVTGQEKQMSEQWLWFLISKPLISFSSKDRSTVPSSEIDIPGSTYYTSRYPDSNPSPSLQISGRGEVSQLRPPPNFPHPVPNSWVVFACPGANVTAYPSITEEYTATPPQIPEKARHPFLQNYTSVLSNKIVHKRKDYDFSHQGVPVFEFSPGKEIFFTSEAATPRFLSVDDIGTFQEGDTYNRRTNSDHHFAAHAAISKMRLMNPDEFKKEQARGRDRLIEKPGKFNGQWWDSFVDKAYEDAGKWEWIKKAMIGGKCRVIVRWMEVEVNPLVKRDTDILIDSGAVKSGGVGLGLLLGEVENNARKKRKLSSSGLAVPISEENMRTEAIRRGTLSDAVIGEELTLATSRAVRGKKPSSKIG